MSSEHTPARGPFNGAVQPNYPRNSWWVAALSGDVGDRPFGCWMLDSPVVLYRKRDGAVVALEDRCPHRWAPLSAGHVDGDDLVCGYHGFQFCPSGACVKIPSQTAVPSSARVRSYPVVERAPLIWVWTGDPALAAEAPPPPAFAWLSDPAWTVVGGTTPLAANYMLLKENVLDLTHFGFVHRNSIQVLDWNRPPKVESPDTTVTYSQEFPSSPLAWVYGVPTGIGSEKPVYRRSWGRYLTPAANLGAVDIRDPAPAPGARAEFAFRVLHLTTPESATQTRYWWFQAWDVALPADYVEKWRAGVHVGYGEDKTMLDLVQRLISRDPRGCDYPEVLARADEAAILARRKVAALVAAERGASREGVNSGPPGAATAPFHADAATST